MCRRGWWKSSRVASFTTRGPPRGPGCREPSSELSCPQPGRVADSADARERRSRPRNLGMGSSPSRPPSYVTSYATTSRRRYDRIESENGGTLLVSLADVATFVDRLRNRAPCFASWALTSSLYRTARSTAIDGGQDRRQYARQKDDVHGLRLVSHPECRRDEAHGDDINRRREM